MKRTFAPLAGISILALAASASAQLFADDFEVDSTANWSFNSSTAADSRNDNNANEANYFFDYSTIGIPLAPHSSSGGTRGLKMEANVFGTTGAATQRGMSTSPIGQSFTGNYKLSFDCWMNFQGPMPGGGSGTTQLGMAGIGVNDTSAQFVGTNWNGVGFATTYDGGSAIDYRAQINVGASLDFTSGAYAAGNVSGVQNSSHAYYSGLQGTVPAAQTAWANGQGFLDQTGSTNFGAAGMAWRYWEIEKLGSTVTWKIDGLLIATVANADVEMAGTNIFLGAFDSNSAISTQAISRDLLFTLVDNVQVVPEPATMATLGIGALALLRRRKK